MNEPLVLEGVGLSRGARVLLRDASMRLAPGVTVLLGPSGAGKSTLLRLALGVLAPDAGTVRVLGHDPAGASRALREAIGYVPDRPDVPGWMTAAELFAFLAPQHAEWDAALLADLTGRLQLPLDVPFERLSRGEGSKAMLAAALAQQPRLLLLDEPFSGFDPPTREEMLSAFLETLDPSRTAVLHATHDLETAARVADEVAVLFDGTLSPMGRIDDVLELMGEGARIPSKLRELYDDEIRAAIAEVLAR